MADVHTAAEIIAALNLAPHPEGGYFAETFRDEVTLPGQERSVSTAIYYLLRAGERSHWHRVDAVEIWHHYAGSPLLLAIAAHGAPPAEHVLGPVVATVVLPQIVMPRGYWACAHC